MKVSHIIAAAGLVVATLATGTAANADRGDGWHRDHGRHSEWNRHDEWRRHRHCWMEWHHHRQVRVCR